MKLNTSFEVVDVSGEYMIIPLNNSTEVVNGVIVVTEAVAYLLKNMQDAKSEQDLVDLLMMEYDVEYERAQEDVHTMVEKLTDLGVITT